MGKGRAPCCDKSQVKKGPWSPAEDLKLITFIQKQGHENWRALPKQAGLLRCGKSCRLRWINYLRPDVKRGNFTKEEEDTILRLHETMGNKWSKIASHFPGRTDNEIKNVWNTHLKKKLAFRDVNKDRESKESSLTSSSTSSSNTNMSSGKRRAETELDEHQWGHNHVLKKPRESGDKVAEESNQMISTSKEMIMKELSISSCSSDNSIVSNSSQVDATRPEDKMGSSFFDFTTHNEPYYQVGISINNCEEVNKPEIISDNELQIPLESDLDFWNMLDSLGTFQSNDQLVQLHEAEPSQSSSFGEANNINNKEADADSRKWLQYLENELGLETTEDQNSPKMEASASASSSAEPEPLIPAETCEILLKSEVDPGISYFQLWSSSVF